MLEKGVEEEELAANAKSQSGDFLRGTERSAVSAGARTFSPKA
jgi:hypothetical protein